MLKEKTAALEVGEIITLRLVTGEEVIGRIADLNQGEVFLEKPHTPVVVNDRGGMGLAPAVLLGDMNKPVVYSRTQIVSRASPREEIKTEYERMLTGIVTPNKGIVLPQQNKK